jgi:hypothetical protein
MLPPKCILSIKGHRVKCRLVHCSLHVGRRCAPEDLDASTYLLSGHATFAAARVIYLFYGCHSTATNSAQGIWSSTS